METMNDLQHIAIHEAGHAVIGRILTLPCREATIKPDFDEGWAGYSHHGEFWSADAEWLRRGKCRTGQPHLQIAHVINLMAGAEAEIELLGNCEGGDGNDRKEISAIGRQFDFSEARLRKMTRMLVRRHRALIERVADALLAETTLSGPDLDKLVGRSIDDVKPNMSAELIAFHQQSWSATLQDSQ
jgi:hypothetical protein